MSVAAVAAGPGGGVWAVGERFDKIGCTYPQIAGLLDGRWKTVPTPRTVPNRCSDFLTDVAVVNGHTAWAVGMPGDYEHLSLIDRWDGHRWRLANPVGIGGDLTGLNDVTVVPGSGNIWAVGAIYTTEGNPGALHRVNGHWQGYRLLGGPGWMSAVASAGRGATWAFGRTNGTRLLIDRWAHGRWRQVPAPAGAKSVEIDAADASPDGDIWAVGQRVINANLHETQCVMVHRSPGTGWRLFTIPARPLFECNLTGVAAASNRRAWAVGYDGPDALLLHWVTPHWIRVHPPSIPGIQTGLQGVTKVPDQRGDYWAVGWKEGPSGVPTPLVLRRG